MRDSVTVDNGKYTFFTDKGGLLNCLRYGDPWPGFRANGKHFGGCWVALYHELLEAQQPARKPISANDLRRLRDGTEALQVAGDIIGASGLRPRGPSKLISGPKNLAIINDARTALQSLDDLGYPELNNLVAQVDHFLGRVT